MPRFYFHLHDDVIALDDEGRELADVAEARAAAVAGAREIIADQVREGRLNLRHRIVVEDENCQQVLTVPFRAVVEIET